MCCSVCWWCSTNSSSTYVVVVNPLLPDYWGESASVVLWGFAASFSRQSSSRAATPAHMFNVAIQPILTYGCTTLNFTRSSVKELDKVQSKLLKSALGLPKFCHNTPLLQASKVKKIDNLLQVHQLSLLQNALLNKSKA